MPHGPDAFHARPGPWRVPPGLALHFRRVGGRVAVLNEESGDVHLFVPAAAELLRQLQEDACFAQDLEEGAPPGAGSQGKGGAVTDLLSELHRLGLIEPARD